MWHILKILARDINNTHAISITISLSIHLLTMEQGINISMPSGCAQDAVPPPVGVRGAGLGHRHVRGVHHRVEFLHGDTALLLDRSQGRRRHWKGVLKVSKDSGCQDGKTLARSTLVRSTRAEHTRKGDKLYALGGYLIVRRVCGRYRLRRQSCGRASSRPSACTYTYMYVSYKNRTYGIRHCIYVHTPKYKI